MSDEPKPEEPPVVPGQQSMFGDEDVHRAWGEWKGMPEMVSDDKVPPYRSIIVHFRSKTDVERFALMVEQPIGPNVKSMWWPKLVQRSFADKRYVSEAPQR